MTNVRLDKASPDGHGLLIDRRREVFSQTVRANPSVDPVIEQAMGDEVAVTGPDGEVPSSGPVNGALFFGTDVLDHVDIVEGTDGTGVWLADYVAEPLDVRPGDQVELRSETPSSPSRSTASIARSTRCRAPAIGAPGTSSSTSPVSNARFHPSRSWSIGIS